jgi:predicted nucleic acid-binding protein
MILVDTNVVSEAMRVRPHQAVANWVDAQSADSLYLCTPVLAELRYGIECLDDVRQKELLLTAVNHFENELYRGRILSFDQAAAAHYARLAASRERRGRRMGQMDALIAAIAATHGATIATRDVYGFSGIGLHIINPFEEL